MKTPPTLIFSSLEKKPSGDFVTKTHDIPTIEMFGNKIACINTFQAVDIVFSFRQDKILVFPVNVAVTVWCQENEWLRSFYQGVDLVTCDGRGLLYASWLMGSPLPEMVGGPGLWDATLDQSSRSGLGVFLLGSTPQLIRRAASRALERYPNSIYGYRDGYFGREEVANVIAEINNSGAEILMIGMPTPTKERFASFNRDALKTKVIIGVGGYFDVLAGDKKLAPCIIRTMGFEWLFRGLQEPCRLLPRYLRINLKFGKMLLQYLIRHYRHRLFR